MTLHRPILVPFLALSSPPTLHINLHLHTLSSHLQPTMTIVPQSPPLPVPNYFSAFALFCPSLLLLPLLGADLWLLDAHLFKDMDTPIATVQNKPPPTSSSASVGALDAKGSRTALALRGVPDLADDASD